MAGFRSLRQRMAGGPDPDEVLPLDVHPHMRQPMLGWLEDSCAVYGGSQYWELMVQMLQIDYTGKRPHDAIIEAVNKDNGLLVDLIDARLRLGDAWSHHAILARILALAGSGWRLNEDKDGLEQVVEDTVREAAMAAIKEAEESASQHLKNAWTETHSRDRNPTHAHAEMIRAVESAARPVVTPKDDKATLGKIYRQMETQGSLYTTAGASDANDGVAGIVVLMKTLWEQQTDRHGANPTIPATQERVEFLLPIAAALVNAFSTGAVRRI